MADELIVVGGGAAGMMAAISAAETGAAVRLLERNPKVGRKLYITGKGRCNVTNHCPPEEVLASTSSGGQWLVTLHRPLPVMYSLRPTLGLRSSSRTAAPVSAAEMAAIMPAAPPPTTISSSAIGQSCTFS